MNGLKELSSSDELSQTLKYELKEIQNEIQPNKLSLVVGKLIEKKEWKWKSSLPIVCERIDIHIDSLSIENKIRFNEKQSLHQIDNQITNECIIPNEVNCEQTVDVMLTLIKEQKIKERLDEIEKNVSTYQYETYQQLKQMIDPIRQLLRSIVSIKQRVIQQRKSSQLLTIEQQFDEWLQCGDKIINENDTLSYTLSNQNQWNTIGLSMQIFVAFQSIFEMMKEVELFYKNIYHH